MISEIDVKNLYVSYGEKDILSDISISIEKGKITSIIGVNGCGKSTFLKSIGGIIPFRKGSVDIAGKPLKSYKKKNLAKRLAYLSQRHTAPSDITVEELVAFGRFSHRKWYEQASKKDIDVIDKVIDITGLTKYRKRRVSTLSGGENQKAWIAMSLCQEPDILLLDEPTTFLDIYHQIEVMELLRKLNQKSGLSILMVVHDINHAYKYSDTIIAIKDRNIYSSGESKSIINPDLIENVFHIKTKCIKDNQCGCVFHPYEKEIK